MRTAMIWALAAALLASSCGRGWPGPVTVQDAGVVTTCSITADASATCPERSYSVGGAISGLTRAGLVLANGPHLASVAANTTTFTLPAPPAHTNTYAVEIAAQPAGLTCSVSNGSGLMPPDNVTSVKVKCLNSAYTIGKPPGDLNVKALMLFLALARSARLGSM